MPCAGPTACRCYSSLGVPLEAGTASSSHRVRGLFGPCKSPRACGKIPTGLNLPLSTILETVTKWRKYVRACRCLSALIRSVPGHLCGRRFAQSMFLRSPHGCARSQSSGSKTVASSGMLLTFALRASVSISSINAVTSHTSSRPSDSRQGLRETLVAGRGFLSSLQKLARLQADAPLKETLHWTARGAINIMDQNRDFLRLIIMEGLGGDEAALEQYGRLLGLWEDALTSVLRRYEDKGELPQNSAPTVARHIIYTILMTFQESLLGRHVSPSAQAEDRRAALSEFVTPALDHILQGLAQNS